MHAVHPQARSMARSYGRRLAQGPMYDEGRLNDMSVCGCSVALLSRYVKTKIIVRPPTTQTTVSINKWAHYLGNQQRGMCRGV
jgi:hypothetical protein